MSGLTKEGGFHVIKETHFNIEFAEVTLSCVNE